MILHPQMIEILIRRQQREVFDRAGRPTGDVSRQLLDDREGAFAAAVAQRVGDLCPCADPFCGRRTDPEQVAEIRDHPLVTRLDEPVLVEALNLLFEDFRLLAEDLEEILERLTVFHVPLTVNGGQQGVERLGVVATHGIWTSLMS